VALKDRVVFKFEYPRKFAIRAWTLDITDEKKQSIRHFEKMDQLPEELIWDACTDRNEVVLANRRFGYVLRIQDSLGNIWQQADAIRSTPVNYLGSTPEGGRNRVQIEQILFDFDSAILKPDMSDKLNKAADLALAHDANNTYFIVDGHTDEIGSERYNLSLSKQRSNMVMRYLVEELRIPSQMINTYGYGKSRPLTKGLDPETRTRNRRVEIILNLPK
jgi:outer membrane protein OmpA-like peptidoglycan-associated protein